MKGVQEPYDHPAVPPRQPGEDILHWMERIAKANGYKPPPADRQPGEDG